MPVSEVLDVTLKPTQQKALTQRMLTAIRSTRDARQGMDDKIAAAWERFEGLEPRRTLPFANASNLRILLTWWTIRSIWVRTMRTVFGQSPVLRITDENRMVGPDAGLMEQALTHLGETDLRLRATESHVFINSFVEGTGVAKLRRDTQTRRVRDRVGDILMERMVTDRVGLGLDVLDLKDFVVANPAIVDINRQPWVAHRVWLRWDDIVRRQRDGIYRLTKRQLATIKPLVQTRRTHGEKPLDQAKAEADQADDQGAPYEVEEYPIWETQWRYDLDGDGLEEDILGSLMEGFSEAPLRIQKSWQWNGRREYLIFRPIPRANRFYGMSVAVLLQSLQDEADTRLNQSLSAATLAILAALTPILSRALKHEWENHEWALGKPIFLDAPETLQTVASIMKYNPALGEVDLNRLFQLAERSFGVSDIPLGRPVSGDRTAYEISQVVQEGNINFSEMIEQLQDTNRELGYQVMEHAYQLAQESDSFRDRLIRVCDGRDPFEGLTMADLRQRYDLKPTGNTVVANRDIETRKWLAIWTLLKDEPLVNADQRRRWNLLQQVLHVALPEEDIQEFIGTEQEVVQRQQMQEATGGIAAGMQLGKALGGGNGQAFGGIPTDSLPTEP